MLRRWHLVGGLVVVVLLPLVQCQRQSEHAEEQAKKAEPPKSREQATVEAAVGMYLKGTDPTEKVGHAWTGNAMATGQTIEKAQARKVPQSMRAEDQAQVLMEFNARPKKSAVPGRVGTWTDPKSGLTWQVTPTGGEMNWEMAKAHCSNLNLDGGGWRLPTIGELRTLIRGCPGTEAGGRCNVEQGKCLAWSCKNDTCNGCSTRYGPSKGGMYWPDPIEGEEGYYWSSSAVEGELGFAWFATSLFGALNSQNVNRTVLVRCAR